MANEFFTALPGALDAAPPDSSSFNIPANAPTDVPSNFAANPWPRSNPATIPSAPPEVSLPSDQHFPSLPASAGPASVAPVTVPAQVTPPAVPGAAASTAGEFTPEPPIFSFLQDARPIVSDRYNIPSYPSPYPPAQPVSSFTPHGTATAPDASSTNIPAGRPIYAPTIQALPTSEAQPSQATVVQLPSPAPPSSFGTADASPVAPFSFLEELRSIFTYPPSIPGPVPAAPDAEPPLKSSTPDLQLANDLLRASEISELSRLAVSFGFIEDQRPLDPATSASSSDLNPPGIEPDVARDLNLSSYPFDAEALKRDFPILRERVNGRPLVWLDNAATTQKPQSVIDRLAYFYEHENSNVHRAAHELAARATDAYESAREKVRRFLNASSTREIIFVRGATEGINLIAQSWGRRYVQRDDEIVITWLEHHANIVPWQMLCSEKGAKLRVAPVDDSGQVVLDEYEKLLNPRTRLVSITQVSNALGVVTPADKMIEIAKRYGAKTLLDGAQSVSHMRVDVQAFDCDFFVFSGHKVFAPTGIGVVYGKPEVLESMPPWQGGGNMIHDVTFEKTLYQNPPQRFEAGTGNIADAVGLGAAIDYLDRVGMPNISRHEHELLVHATDEFLRIPGLHIIGTAKEKAGVLSFILDGFRTEEVGDFLNQNGIAVRSGHHCAQPILRRFGLESTVRASLALYNTHEDIDRLVTALWNLRLGRTTLS
jgi:cysteine desulfurase / selenocysteine lyase